MVNSRTQISVTSVRMMDSLYQTELFQFFQCPVHRHQSHPNMRSPTNIIHILRAKGPLALRHNLDNHPARLSKSVSALLD